MTAAAIQDEQETIILDAIDRFHMAHGAAKDTGMDREMDLESARAKQPGPILFTHAIDRWRSLVRRLLRQ